MVSHFVSLSFFDLLHFVVPKIINVVAFLEKRWKTLFSGSDLLVSKTFAREESVLFSITFDFLVCNHFSLRFKTTKNQTKKKHFLFLFSHFLFHFFLSTFSFFSLPSLLSLFTFPFHFFVHFFLLFSLFLSPLFSILSFFCISCFLICFFSIAVFVYPLFVVTHFASLSFVLDLILLCFLFFLHLRICSFAQPNSTFSVVNFFFEDEMGSLIFEPSFLLCFVLCFSSLRRPYSLSLPCFTVFLTFLDILFLDFLVSIFFSGLVQIVVLLLDKSCKKKFFLKETLVFLVLRTVLL